MLLVFNLAHPAQIFKHWQFIVGFLVLFAFIGNNTAKAALTNGLVAHYCFDNKASLGQDCSGKGNNGVIEGSVSYVTGIRGGGAKFGGIKKLGNILVKNSASLRFSKALTISAFVKISDSTGWWHRLLDKGGMHNDHYDGLLMTAVIDIKDRFFLFAKNEDELVEVRVQATTIKAKKSQWVHVAYVIDNKISKLYFDGVLVGPTIISTSPVDFSIANQHDLTIGRYNFDGDLAPSMLLDEMRIYNRALTAAEIKLLYTSTIAKPPQKIYKGQFVAPTVSGLVYKTATRTGVTDAKGFFTYSQPNELISFSFKPKLGLAKAATVSNGLELGILKAAPLVLVTDFIVTADQQQAGANIRKAQVLQSADQDKNLRNGIQLDPKVTQLFDGKSLNFNTSQKVFDTDLKAKLASVSRVPVTSEKANAQIDSYAKTLAAKCPLPDIEPITKHNISDLSCIEKARLNYFRVRIEPHLYEQINASSNQTALVEESFNEKVADTAIDTNPVLSALEYADGIVDGVDDLEKKAYFKALPNITAALSKSVATLLNVLTWRNTSPTFSEEAERVKVIGEISEKAISAIASTVECSQFFENTALNDKLAACSQIIIDLLNVQIKAQKATAKDTFKLPEDLKTITEIHKSLILIADGLSAIKKIEKLEKAKKAGLTSAAFGVASSVLKIATDASSLALSNKGEGILDKTKYWAVTSIGLINKVSAPILKIGEKCYSMSKNDPIGSVAKKWECFSTISQETGKVAIKASVASIGTFFTIKHVGTMNENVVARAVLEEILWAGGDFQKLYAKFPFSSAAQALIGEDAARIKAISKKRPDTQGLTGIDSYLDITAVALNYIIKDTTSYSIPEASSLVDFYYNQILQNTPANFNTPVVELSQSKSKPGEALITGSVNPAKSGITNGKLFCSFDESTNRAENNPWIITVKGVTPFQINASYESGGITGLMCRFYSASGLFIGSKALGLTIENPPITIAKVAPPTNGMTAGTAGRITITGKHLPASGLTAKLGTVNCSVVSGSSTKWVFSCTPAAAGVSVPFKVSYEGKAVGTLTKVKVGASNKPSNLYGGKARISLNGKGMALIRSNGDYQATRIESPSEPCGQDTIGNKVLHNIGGGMAAVASGTSSGYSTQWSSTWTYGTVASEIYLKSAQGDLYVHTSYYLFNGTNGCAPATLEPVDFPNKIIALDSYMSLTNGSAYVIDTKKSLWRIGKSNYDPGVMPPRGSKNRTSTKLADNVETISTDIDKEGAFGIIKSDGTAWVIGDMRWSAYADNSPNFPTLAKVASDVKSIALGYTQSLILKNDGTVWVAGFSPFGSNKTCRINMQIISPCSGSFENSGLTDIIAIGHGGLALKSNGELMEIGATGWVSILTNVKEFARRNGTTIALRNDNTLWAKGNNNGIFGNGTTENAATFIKILDNF